MVSLELITDNNLLQEEMYRVAVAGYPVLAASAAISFPCVEQTLGMVARVWFKGASGIGVELDDMGAGWAIGLVDIVESFSVRHSFPWISDCVSENTTHPAILISRQMLCLTVEHRWSLSESYENGRHLADALAPSVFADFGGAPPR